jgi:DNA mismatch endonuclease, patch repair protein
MRHGAQLKTGHTPSFGSCKPSSPKASRVLSASKSADTRCERLLRSECWKKGLRFRKNVRALPGRPDIVFLGAHVAVFCDGDFWHGRNWLSRRRKLRQGPNASYWVAKIGTNMQRDRRTDKQLRRLGWKVVRLWELDILKNPSRAARRVARAVCPTSSRRPPCSPHRLRRRRCGRLRWK